MALSLDPLVEASVPHADTATSVYCVTVGGVGIPRHAR